MEQLLFAGREMLNSVRRRIGNREPVITNNAQVDTVHKIPDLADVLNLPPTKHIDLDKYTEQIRVELLARPYLLRAISEVAPNERIPSLVADTINDRIILTHTSEGIRAVIPHLNCTASAIEYIRPKTRKKRRGYTRVLSERDLLDRFVKSTSTMHAFELLHFDATGAFSAGDYIALAGMNLLINEAPAISVSKILE